MKAYWLCLTIGVTGAVTGCDKSSETVVLHKSQQQPKFLPLQVVGTTPASSFDLGRLRLSGITSTSKNRQAWVALDGAPPLPLKVGEEVLGATVTAVEMDYVIFDVAGVIIKLPFQSFPAASSRSAQVTPLKEPGPLAKALAFQSSGGAALPSAPVPTSNGNAAFSQALQELAQQARAKQN